MRCGVNKVRSEEEDVGPNIRAKGARVTAEEVMTTRLIEGVRLAALRIERVMSMPGCTISRS